MADKFRKALLVRAPDITGEVDDWCIQKDIDNHTDDDSLVTIAPENQKDNPMIKWLESEGVDLEDCKDSDGVLYLIITSL